MKPCAKFFLYLVLMLCSMIIIPNVYSKLIYFSLEEIVSRSDVIIYGKVLDVRERFFERNVCVFTVERVVAGQLKERRIKIDFGRRSVLYAKEDLTNFKIGKYYVLFLRKDDKNFSLVGAHQGCYLVREDGNVWRNNNFVGLNKFIEEIEKIISEKRTLRFNGF